MRCSVIEKDQRLNRDTEVWIRRVVFDASTWRGVADCLRDFHPRGQRWHGGKAAAVWMVEHEVRALARDVISQLVNKAVVSHSIENMNDRCATRARPPQDFPGHHVGIPHCRCHEDD